MRSTIALADRPDKWTAARGTDFMKLTTARDQFIQAKRDGRRYGEMNPRRRASAPRTQQIYTQRIALFIDWMLVTTGRESVTQFSADLVARYLEHREGRGLAKNTLYMDLNALREFARWGVDRRYWTAEAVRDFPSVTRPASVPRAYGAGERDRIMDLELAAPEDHALRALLYYGLLRLGEILALRLKDLVPPDTTVPGKLYIHGKGARERVVYIHAHLWAALVPYLRTLPKGTLPDRHLFVHDVTRVVDGHAERLIEQPWTERMVRDRVHAWGRRAEVLKPQPHRFRHTGASDMLEHLGERSLKAIQELLGHSSLATTQIYLKVSDRQKAEAIASLPGFGVKDSRPGCPMPASDETRPGVTPAEETTKP